MGGAPSFFRERHTMHHLYLTPTDISHDTPFGHPENQGRIGALLQGIHKPQARDLGLITYNTSAAPYAEIMRLHEPAYIEALNALEQAGGGMLDHDTYMGPQSLQAALHSAGGASLAAQTLLHGHADTAFVATRPPGHHALSDKAMGFCFFGNAAIAAKAATNQGARAVVLDFDVHHGNGTQALLWDEPDTFFASTHQLSAWPQTGRKDETGGKGRVLNIPLKSGAGSRRMQEAWTHILEQAKAFKPDIVIVSAGFDAHQNDPLGGFSWRNEDYTFLGKAIREMANDHAQGRVLSLLEGGYEQSVLRQAGRLYLEGLIFG